MAKSSVSVWVRDVPVPPDARYWATGGRTVERPADAGPVRRLRVWTSGETQRCSRCGLVLPGEAFNRLGERRQYYCRDCFLAYYQQHGGSMRPRWYAGARDRVAHAREHVLVVLSQQTCADCGEGDPVVLEFDHVGPKVAHIADLTASGRAISIIAAEMEECEVVCVCCHRRRTASRAGWARAQPDWRAAIARRQPAVRRALKLVYGHLEQHGCDDCGTHDLIVLEFDHVGVKRFDVARAAWIGRPHDEIAAEIATCVVRCGNCHRRRTAERGGHHRCQATRPLPS